MSKYDYIPEGYQAIVPSLAFRGTTAAIEWYKTVFGAKERMRLENPDKTVGHAELIIGDSLFMVGEEKPPHNRSAKSVEGNSVSLYLYVKDVDATVRKAADNKANVDMPPEEMLYGDKVARITDPFGYTWLVATHVKDVSIKEMSAKMKAMADAHA